MAENRRVLIARLPEGPLAPDHFALETAPLPEPAEGEVLCRVLALTIGAGQRAGLQGSASYAGAPVTGVVMGGTGVARVVASRSPDYHEGDLVSGPTGWQEYAALPARELHRLDPSFTPADHLGALGVNGLTAYFGLFEIGRPRPGETVVVSAAAGSVGHIAGQLAKIAGAHVVGVAGSEAKCRLLTEELGFHAAVNYKDPGFRAAFKDATPRRIDVYFDNTGGPVLESALFRMNTHGRIACCGNVSQYDTANPGPGPRGIPGLLVNNRVRMEGFLLFDFAARYDEGRAQIGTWLSEGRLRPLVTTFEGIAAAPRAFVALLNGQTTGTTVVHVSD